MGKFFRRIGQDPQEEPSLTKSLFVWSAILGSGLVAGSVASAATTATESVPTFYKDVLPVIQKNCQGCHRPGEAAPMAFLTYEGTRPWAKAMKAAVLTKKMPPWFADPHYGKFANDRTLAAADVSTIVNWADNGAPAGNPADAPGSIHYVEGWRIPEPDLVLQVPKPFHVPAEGTIAYQYVVVPTGFTEDKWVQFAEARPSNPALVHHIIAFIREPGNPMLKELPPGVFFAPTAEAAKRRREGGGKAEDQDSNGFFGDMIAGYAPGTVPFVMRPGQARLVKAGSDIVFQLHYTANGKAGDDQAKLGLVFSKEPPKERVLTLGADNWRFAIPPGDPNYRVDAKLTLQEDSTLLSLIPHMHFRGKDFEYRVTYPDGRRETLLSVPHYNFNWQLTYDLAEPRRLPKGTVIECTAHYDNSPNNPFNPDPTKTVYPGEQTWEEMMIGFFDVAVPPTVGQLDLMVPKKASGAQQSGGLQ